MVSELTLNNGVTMPALGFGVFQSAPEETARAVTAALDTGYRLVDTAATYGNERNVGEGIRGSGIDRDDVFIETKIWVGDFGYDTTLHAFTKATRKLGFDQIDLLLLHQPAPAHGFDRTIAAYKALETLLADGRVRAIGVSNFMPHHLERLFEETDVVPSVNQVELHPYFSQPEVQHADAEHGIVTQAWSPIGGITFYRPEEGKQSVMDDPVIVSIAQGHSRTPAQVMLRWHLQRGRAAVPKSTNPVRIAENFAVFDFQLEEDELNRIDALDTGVRGGPDPDGPSVRWDRVIPED